MQGSLDSIVVWVPLADVDIEWARWKSYPAATDSVY
jgi:hypothetical protein